MPSNAGKIVTDVVINTGEARDALQMLQNAADLTGTSLAELGGGSIEINNIDQLQDNFVNLNVLIQNVEGSYKRADDEQDKYSKTVGNALGGIKGLISAYSQLTSGQRQGSSELKNLENSLGTALSTMNSTTSAFSMLGEAGVALGGTIGTVGTAFEAAAGPAGIIIGLGVGLIQFFNDTGDSAEKASEKYHTALENLQKNISGGLATPKDFEEMINKTQQSINEMEAEAKAIKPATIRYGQGEYAGLVVSKEFTKEQQTQLDNIKKAIELRREEISIYQSHLPGAGEKARIAKEEEDKKKEEQKKAEQEAKDKKENEAREAAELDKQRTDFERKLDVGVITDKYKLREELAEQEYADDEKKAQKLYANDEKAMAKALDKAGKIKQNKLDAIDQDRQKEKSDKVTQENNKAKQREKERHEYEISLMDETDAAQQREYDKIKELRERDVIDDIELKQREEQIDKKFAEQKIAQEQEVAEQKRAIAIQSVGQSVAILSQMFPQVKAFAVAESMINTYQAATKALSSVPPPFNIILMAATIASGLAQVAKITSTNPGFSEGGYTGDGNRYDAAGTVHKGEIVFEKPLVDRNKAEILAIRYAMQRGASIQGTFMQGGTDVYSLIIAGEIRSLRNDLKDIQFRQDVVLQGTMQGQKFFRKEFPRYSRSAGEKNV